MCYLEVTLGEGTVGQNVELLRISSFVGMTCAKFPQGVYEISYPVQGRASNNQSCWIL